MKIEVYNGRINLQQGMTYSRELFKDLLSFRMLSELRDQFTDARLDGWKWYRVGNDTVVFLFSDWDYTMPAGIGWARRGPLDPMNERVGITVALVRALRNVKDQRKSYDRQRANRVATEISD